MANQIINEIESALLTHYDGSAVANAAVEQITNHLYHRNSNHYLNILYSECECVGLSEFVTELLFQKNVSQQAKNLIEKVFG